MNRVANTYWVDNRLTAQRPTARALSLSSAHEQSRVHLGTRAESRPRGQFIPSWVIFSMIILATFACCITVTLRTHAEMHAAEQRHQQISANVEQLRNTNASLARRVQRLHSDPEAIEAAARAQLGMVRAGELIVKVD